MDCSCMLAYCMYVTHWGLLLCIICGLSCLSFLDLALTSAVYHFMLLWISTARRQAACGPDQVWRQRLSRWIHSQSCWYVRITDVLLQSAWIRFGERSITCYTWHEEGWGRWKREGVYDRDEGMSDENKKGDVFFWDTVYTDWCIVCLQQLAGWLIYRVS